MDVPPVAYDKSVLGRSGVLLGERGGGYRKEHKNKQFFHGGLPLYRDGIYLIITQKTSAMKTL